jgi:hypothetical protein
MHWHAWAPGRLSRCQVYTMTTQPAHGRVWYPGGESRGTYWRARIGNSTHWTQ